MTADELMALRDECRRLRVELQTVADVWRVREVLVERDRLRAELEEVRRQLLPHPDAKGGEDRGCGCDMYTAVAAAAWASAGIKRLRADVAALRNERDRLRVELQTVTDVWRVREVLVERDRLRAELERVQADRRELREELGIVARDLTEQKQLNLQLAERLAACSQVLGRAAEKGRVCGCQTQGGVR